MDLIRQLSFPIFPNFLVAGVRTDPSVLLTDLALWRFAPYRRSANGTEGRASVPKTLRRVLDGASDHLRKHLRREIRDIFAGPREAFADLWVVPRRGESKTVELHATYLAVVACDAIF